MQAIPEDLSQRGLDLPDLGVHESNRDLTRYILAIRLRSRSRTAGGNGRQLARRLRRNAGVQDAGHAALDARRRQHDQLSTGRLRGYTHALLVGKHGS